MVGFPGKLVSFNPVIYYNNIYLIIMGIVAFLTQCQLLHLLRYNKTIAVLGRTLANSASDMLGFGFIFFIIFLAFTIGTNQLFFELYEYSTMAICFGTQLSGVLGGFSLTDVVANYGMIGVTFILIYLLIMAILTIDIFVSLLHNFLGNAKKDRSIKTNDFKVVDHLLDTMKSFIIRNRERTESGTCAL